MAETRAAKKPSDGSALKKKAGGVPVWLWVVAAVVVGYFVLRSRGSSASTTASGSSTPASSSTDTGTPSGISDQSLGTILSYEQGQQSNLLAGILGSQAALVDVNSNLTSGLINSQNAIVGLGETALTMNGQLEQAIIDKYTPTAPAVSGGTSSNGGGGGGGNGGVGGSNPQPSPPTTTHQTVQQQIAASPTYWALPPNQQASLMRGSMYSIPSYLSHGGAV